jgi:hypothetical protein
VAVGFGVSTAEHVKQVRHNSHLSCLVQDLGLFPTLCLSFDILYYRLYNSDRRMGSRWCDRG